MTIRVVSGATLGRQTAPSAVPGLVALQLDKPSFKETDASDKPSFVTQARSKRPVKIKSLFKARVRALASVDQAVARTVRLLDRVGKLDSTLIIFTSENGYLLGEHRYRGGISAGPSNSSCPGRAP